MTIPQKRAVVTGLLTLVIGASVVGVGNIALSSVVFRDEFNAQGAVIVGLERDVREIRELTLDVLCAEAIRPTDRRCR